VKIGIPFIGCPDYLPLMEQRAKKNSLSLSPPHLPNSLRAYIAKNDPASAPYTSKSDENPFLGKLILVLSGADDKLVPWSASQSFVEKLEVGEHGEKMAILQPKTGHTMTNEMMDETAKFIWKWALAKEFVFSRL